MSERDEIKTFKESVKKAWYGPDDSATISMDSKEQVARDLERACGLKSRFCAGIINPPNYSIRSTGSEDYEDYANQFRYSDYLNRMRLMGESPLDFGYRVAAGLKAKSKMAAHFRRRHLLTLGSPIKDQVQTSVQRLKLVVK